MTARKWLARGLLAGAVLTSPLLAVLPWFIFSATYPLVIVFITDFEVINDSAQTVWITPLGQFHGKPDGDRYIILQHAVKNPAIPAFHRGGLRLAAGETRQILYDKSDVGVSDIVVADATGRVRVLELPRDGRMPRTFTTPPLGELPDAPESIAWAAREGHYAWLMWGFILLPLIPVALFVLWRRARRTLKGKPSCA